MFLTMILVSFIFDNMQILNLIMMIFSLCHQLDIVYSVQESRSLRSLNLKWQKLCQFLHFLQFSALASHWHKTNVLCQIMTKLIAESVALNNRNVKLMDVAGNLSKIIQPICLGNCPQTSSKV